METVDMTFTWSSIYSFHVHVHVHSFLPPPTTMRPAALVFYWCYSIYKYNDLAHNKTHVFIQLNLHKPWQIMKGRYSKEMGEEVFYSTWFLSGNHHKMGANM